MSKDYDYDMIVIGAGPAGLGASLYGGRAMMDTLVLEKVGPGGQLTEAYDIQNYPGFEDNITGMELGQKMLRHAQKFDVEVKNAEVKDITTDGPVKTVDTGKDTFSAPIVIVAAGASHRKLQVSGEEELAGAGVSYCATCDGAFFRDKKLVTVGGGDSAITESIFLTRFASQVSLVHRRQGFRARAINVKEAKENEKIEFVLDTIVTEILGEEKVEGVRVKNVKTDEEDVMECDGVFILIGHNPNTGFLKTVLPQYAGEVVPTDMNMETEIKGLYAVGDVRKGSYRQIATAVSDGVVAAMHSEQRIKKLVQ